MGMRLPDFILANIEPILAQWEQFARRIWPGNALVEPAELRDDAEAILRATVADMSSDQSAEEQHDKSEGRGGNGNHSRVLDRASVRHGGGRVDSGFRLVQVLAEYRALRSSVVRLWRQSNPAPNVADLDDLTRFHESMDQSLAQAVETFSQNVDQARMLFLAVLGHDLRNPLNAITMSGGLLATRHKDDPVTAEVAGQVTSSALAMDRLIRDLLDFAADGVGGPMPLTRRKVDLHPVCREVAREVQAGHPGCKIEIEAEGDLAGEWDERRLRQVVSNLLANAIIHGNSGSRIRLRLRAEEDAVILSVHNDGEPIPAGMLPVVFDPLRRMAVRGDSGEQSRHEKAGSIGLGLYITRQIVASHGGSIDVTSNQDSGTEFTVRLPRHPSSRIDTPQRGSA